MARRASGAQRDLFTLVETRISWAAEGKQELLAVIETLLLETMAENTVAREAGDEQDHA